MHFPQLLCVNKICIKRAKLVKLFFGHWWGISECELTCPPPPMSPYDCTISVSFLARCTSQKNNNNKRPRVLGDQLHVVSPREYHLQVVFVQKGFCVIICIQIKVALMMKESFHQIKFRVQFITVKCAQRLQDGVDMMEGKRKHAHSTCIIPTAHRLLVSLLDRPPPSHSPVLKKCTELSSNGLTVFKVRSTHVHTARPKVSV